MKKESYENKCLEGKHSRILVSEEFVKINNFVMNKTQQEILEKCLNDSIFGNEKEVLVHYLDFEYAKEFYKDEFVTDVLNNKKDKPLKIDDIFETAQDFLDYMIFGWSKALDERSLSASRTISKCGACLWLLGRDDLYYIIHSDVLYNPYGMPNLIEVCENLGIKVPEECYSFSEIKC